MMRHVLFKNTGQGVMLTADRVWNRLIYIYGEQYTLTYANGRRSGMTCGDALRKARAIAL